MMALWLSHTGFIAENNEHPHAGTTTITNNGSSSNNNNNKNAILNQIFQIDAEWNGEVGE